MEPKEVLLLLVREIRNSWQLSCTSHWLKHVYSFSRITARQVIKLARHFPLGGNYLSKMADLSLIIFYHRSQSTIVCQTTKLGKFFFFFSRVFKKSCCFSQQLLNSGCLNQSLVGLSKNTQLDIYFFYYNFVFS